MLSNTRNTIVRRGFTIVELLIVIVVIAILAAISTAAYTGIQERARGLSIDSMIRSQAKALSLYYVENGELLNTSDSCFGEPSDYPAVGDWGAGECANGAFTTGDLSSKLKSVATGLSDGRILGDDANDYRGIKINDLGNDWVEFEYAIPGNKTCADVSNRYYDASDNETWCEINYNVITMEFL